MRESDRRGSSRRRPRFARVDSSFGLFGVSACETKRLGLVKEFFWLFVAFRGAKMRQKSGPAKEPAEKVVKDIRRMTRRKFSAEEKIRIVLEGLRGEESIAELCRREGIVQNLYYRWSKDFLEAGKSGRRAIRRVRRPRTR